MKRSEAVRLIGEAATGDEARKRLSEAGIGNFYQEMEMDSDTVDAHRDISRNADYSQQHSHLFYELIFCTGGQLDYLLGETRFAIRTGDIIFIPPGIVHCPLLSEPLCEPYERHVLWISAPFVQQLQSVQEMLPMEQEPLVLRTAGTAWNYLKRYFITCIQETEQKAPGWRVSLDACAMQLTVQLARAAGELGVLRSNTGDALQDQVLRYIQAHLSEPLSLGRAARQFHVSESTLTHLFHREIGVGFYRCITQRRMILAKNLIAQGLPMEQVSRQVGFADYSAFYRAFKSEYGITPTQFRRIAAGH